MWVREQVTDLARRSMGAEQRGAALQIERVLHVPGRVVRRHVQRFEAVEVVVDLRERVVDLVAHRHEDVLELLPDHRQRVPAPDGAHPARQRHVHALPQELLVAPAALQLHPPRLEPRLDLLLDGVQLPPRLAPLVLPQLPQPPEEERQLPGLAAEEPRADVLQRLGIAHLGQRGVEVLPKPRKLADYSLRRAVGAGHGRLQARRWPARTGPTPPAR